VKNVAVGEFCSSSAVLESVWLVNVVWYRKQE